MRFQLPQFIETEVKLVGPFTLRQFLWLAGGTSLVVVIYLIVKGVLFFVLALPVAAISIALAFIKIDGTPLVNYAAYALSYLLNPKKYLYRSEQNQAISIPDNNSSQQR